MLFRRLTLLLVALVLGALLNVAPAPASHVSCGDVITQNTTLDSDLIECPRTG